MNVPLHRQLAICLLVAATMLVLVAKPAAAATPLPAPTIPVATQVTMTSITIAWTAPAGPVADYTVQVIDATLSPWRYLATTTGTSFTHTGLTPDKVYQYRVFANPTADSGYTTSVASPYTAITTAPLPDSTPPTKPGTLYASNVRTIYATINIGFSTDNNRVAGYWVQRQVDGVWTDWATNNITTVYLRNLTPGTTYTVAAVAFDPNGNRSPRSEPLTFTTPATTPLPICKVSLTSFWQQYQVSVSVENRTTAPVVNWNVTFTMPAAHTVNYIVLATLSRSGDQATATPTSRATTLGPGDAFNFSFMGTYPVGSALPSGFLLNGTIPCTT